jgi:hypothetical protein
VHAGGVELHDAVRVGQTAVAHAGVRGVQLDDVDASDQGIEHIAARRHHGERLLDAGLRASVLELVAVGRGDHDRLGTAAPRRRRLARERCRNRGSNGCCRPGDEKRSAIDTSAH